MLKNNLMSTLILGLEKIKDKKLKNELSYIIRQCLGDYNISLKNRLYSSKKNCKILSAHNKESGIEYNISLFFNESKNTYMLLGNPTIQDSISSENFGDSFSIICDISNKNIILRKLNRDYTYSLNTEEHIYMYDELTKEYILKSTYKKYDQETVIEYEKNNCINSPRQYFELYKSGNYNCDSTTEYSSKRILLSTKSAGVVNFKDSEVTGDLNLQMVSGTFVYDYKQDSTGNYVCNINSYTIYNEPFATYSNLLRGPLLEFENHFHSRYKKQRSEHNKTYKK